MFTCSSLQVQSQFSFALPAQVITAVRLICCHAYGAVLWRLESSAATSYFKAYSSCIRRIFRLPLNTFSYIVEGHLTAGLSPLRNLVLARYPGFLEKLSASPSKEVSIMAVVASKDARTITASNARLLTEVTGVALVTGVTEVTKVSGVTWVTGYLR